MQNVLIIGVCGFIGKNIAKYFIQKKFNIFGIDLIDNVHIKLNDFKRKILPVSIKDELSDWKIDIIINCAGNANVGYSIVNPEFDFNSSVNLSFSILNSIKESKRSIKYFFLSSAAVYGNPKNLPVSENDNIAPLSPYGFHKSISEKICEEFNVLYGIPITIFRIFSAYGIGLKKQILWDISLKILKNEKLELFGTGVESRDFINIIDISRAFEMLNNRNEIGFDIYNLASGEEIYIREIASIFGDICGVNIKFNNKKRAGDPDNWRASIKKIENLGFEVTVDIKEGIKDYFNWVKEEILKNG